MPAVAKVFVALVLILAGGLVLTSFMLEKIGYLEHNIIEAVVGITLVASGLTFFWTQSKLHKS